MISTLQLRIWSAIGEGMTPWQPHTRHSRLFHYLRVPLLLPLGLLTLVAHTASRCLQGLSWWALGEHGDPHLDFSAVTNDHRNWSKLDVSEVTFDPAFLFGAASCTFQDSGAVHCPHSQWSKWEELKVAAENRSGQSARLYPLYKTSLGRHQLIHRLRALGCNSYRFNIEWAHIEPAQGEHSAEALETYVNLCKALRNAGIEPVVTLHHFSEPQWFHELGSFERGENIEHFLSFCRRVYPALTGNYHSAPLVQKICTINEPGIEAFSRYVRGAFSPGYFLRFGRAGAFLQRMLKAHCAAYVALKGMNPAVEIGFVHQALRMESANPLLDPVAHLINRLTHTTILNFFKTGVFDYKIPFATHLRNEQMSPRADFVGLQYYARPVIGLTGSTSYGEPMTQMPFREDPAGLYDLALETYEAFQKPLYITENGISTHDPKQRSRYNARALYALRRVADTIGSEKVRGYYTWSFCDNSEWDMGRFPQAFGAYALKKDGTLALEPKKGMEPFSRAAARSAAAKDERGEVALN